MNSSKTDADTAPRSQHLESAQAAAATTRREFMLTAGAAGLAAAFPLHPAESASATPAPTPERVAALKKQLGVKQPSFRFKALSGKAASRYEAGPDFPRPSEADTAYKAVSDALDAPWRERLMENAIANARAGRISKEQDTGSPLKARLALAFAVGADAWDTFTESYGVGRANQGYLSWGPVTASPEITERSPFEDDATDLTQKVKKFAIEYGAAKVGVAALDPGWLFTEVCQNAHYPGEPVVKPIRISEEAQIPEETDEAFVLPQRIQHAVVFIVPLSLPATEIAPGGSFSDAAARLADGIRARIEFALAEAIRVRGYAAVPCKEGVAQSVPLAVAAGLGEVGLHGHLITPWWGSHVVIGKVLTDMPLLPDPPIELRVADYCRTCGLCAKACPVDAIPNNMGQALKHRPAGALRGGDPISKERFVLGTRCVSYWVETGGTCRKCSETCPYTKFSIADYWHGRKPSAEGFWDVAVKTYGAEFIPPEKA